MKVNLALVDTLTDGALPVSCEMSVNNDDENQKLVLKFDSLNMEIWVPLYYIGMLFGDEHG